MIKTMYYDYGMDISEMYYEAYTNDFSPVYQLLYFQDITNIYQVGGRNTQRRSDYFDVEIYNNGDAMAPTKDNNFMYKAALSFIRTFQGEHNFDKAVIDNFCAIDDFGTLYSNYCSKGNDVYSKTFYYDNCKIWVYVRNGIFGLLISIEPQ